MSLEIALMIVGALIFLMGIYATISSIYLIVKYFKYNRLRNSVGMTGLEIARSILDAHGLQHIKVKRTGSLLFGNSYSHYFKKVRLRGWIRHETSLTSIGMGAQKAALAILDKEGDPDMKKRVRLVPLLTFGPFMFIPLTLVGFLIDYFIFNSAGSGVFTLVLCAVGFLFYAYSIVLSVLTLKTEKKAQARAYEILERDYRVTGEELSGLKELFHLYNVQYINDIIISSLELLYYALQIALAIKGHDTNK